MLMPNGRPAAVGIEFGAKAGVHAPVSACASGAEAIGYGMDMIRSRPGRRRRSPAAPRPRSSRCRSAAFAAMRRMSTRNDDPERASRPYDMGRDGFVLGEGAGVIVLESRGARAARGARIYAEVAGAGYSSDALPHRARPTRRRGRGVRA